MAKTLIEKVLGEHLVDGELSVGGEIGIRIDQTLTQDATGTTALLLLEAMGAPRVKTRLSVSYVDHNMAQFGPENHNDHLYLQAVAGKVGAWHSRPGSGICHQVHLERFARPAQTLLGSDSHTPTAGGMGMVAIGAGGLDVAVAMAGGAFYLTCPRVMAVELRGRLKPWVAAKDIILRLLSVLTTRGNVGCAVEYCGEGVSTLPVPARATCANMGAELGVTTSVFPADEVTRQFLEAQGRGDAYEPLAADDGAAYSPVVRKLDATRDAPTIANIRRYCTDVAVSQPDGAGMVEVTFGRVVIDLSELEPLAATPSSPDNVAAVADLAGTKVRQVVIGSCTNSGFQDLMLVSRVLAGRAVHPDVELGIAPGTAQVLAMLAGNGALADLVTAGARILESACGPCLGQGFAPAEGAVTVRTFNRNFAGRTGTRGDRAYLVSPETAIAAAIAGRIVDPRELAARLDIPCPQIDPPERFVVDDRMLQPPLPPDEAEKLEVFRPSTIVRPPAGEPLPPTLQAVVLIKVGDKVTTDHIMPAGALLKHRSNVPQYAKYVFNCFNEPGRPTFAEQALDIAGTGKAGAIVAGDSYGQGSSREHAALCPMYLGVRAVIAKAIERIHQANLVNFGILPLTFADPADYDRIDAGDEIVIEDTPGVVASAVTVAVCVGGKGLESSPIPLHRDWSLKLTCRVALTPRQRKILAAGGLLNYTRQAAGG